MKIKYNLLNKLRLITRIIKHYHENDENKLTQILLLPGPEEVPYNPRTVSAAQNISEENIEKIKINPVRCFSETEHSGIFTPRLKTFTFTWKDKEITVDYF